MTPMAEMTENTRAIRTGGGLRLPVSKAVVVHSGARDAYQMALASL